MEGWRNGRMEEWKDRRMEGWRNGGTERGKTGRKEGRKGQVWDFCHPPSPILNMESEDLAGQ